MLPNKSMRQGIQILAGELTLAQHRQLQKTATPADSGSLCAVVRLPVKQCVTSRKLLSADLHTALFPSACAKNRNTREEGRQRAAEQPVAPRAKQRRQSSSSMNLCRCHMWKHTEKNNIPLRARALPPSRRGDSCAGSEPMSNLWLSGGNWPSASSAPSRL